MRPLLIEGERCDKAKARMYDKQKGMCWLCDTKMILSGDQSSSLKATWDHIVPRSRGGTWALDNLKLAHKVCNMKRGNGPWRRMQPPSIPRVPASDKRAQPFTGAWLRAHGYMK